MDLYLIRHADALPLSEGGITDDAERPLSKDGKAQAKKLGTALPRRQVQLELVLTSPLLRARQTAEGMLESWTPPKPELRLCDELAPGGSSKKLARFLRQSGAGSVALVGHQPDLGVHAAWLIGSKKAQVDFGKGGVGLITCQRRPRKGEGTLVWLVTPAWLDSASSSPVGGS
jgi:phosphohistidine phosphatase